MGQGAGPGLTEPTGEDAATDREPDPARWWREAVIYQVYPRSFADSDGDGVGDLPGITRRLDHLVELGVDAVWVSPFYPSPQADGGYDVADYCGVDPLFGSLTDADDLLREAHARGLRVIFDLVPNHTSSAHVWFLAALAAGPGSAERERYLFRDGRGPAGELPPNDWESVFGGPAWTRVTEPDGTPGQWYLHLFDSTQPDLNWDNPQVRADFEDILRFWLDRGVDGFRVDVAHGLVKPTDFTGRRPVTAPAPAPAPGALSDTAPPIWDQDGVHEIYRSWRRLMDGYPGERVLVAEAWVQSAERMAAYVRPDEMHQAFNFDYLEAPWTAAAQREVIDRSLRACAAVGAPTTWVLSNHDVVRHSSRLGLPVGPERVRGIGSTDPQPDPVLGLRRARAATLLMLGLPGSAYLYQGEELGLPEHTTLPDELRQDPSYRRTGGAERGRDGCRVPIPWVAHAPSYGFGPGPASWLPQPPLWARYALDRQRGKADSPYEMYRAALRLRREHRLGSGRLRWHDLGPDVVAFRNGGLLVVANLGDEPVPLPPGATPLLTSGELAGDGRIPTDTTVWALG